MIGIEVLFAYLVGSSLDCVSNRANCCKGRASVSGVVIGLVRISLIILEGQFDRL